MIRNMGTLDRGIRAFVVASVAIVLALILGISTYPRGLHRVGHGVRHA